MTDPILEELYQDIKKREREFFEEFGIPLRNEVFAMGTFDVQTGEFEGRTSTRKSWREEPVESNSRTVKYVDDKKVTSIRQGRMLTVETIPAPETEAITATLEFEVQYPAKDPANTNDPPEWSEIVHFQAAGRSVDATKDKPKVQINIGCTEGLQWSVEGNGKTYEDRIEFRRVPYCLVGALTIPVVPEMIIYEPPPDEARLSCSGLKTTESVGTTFTVGFREEESITKPTQPREYRSASAAKGILETASTVLSKIQNPYTQAAASVASFIAKGLGEASATSTEGTVVINENSITQVLSMEDTRPTGPPNSGGPGIGDLIYYRRNARFLWYLVDGRFDLCLIDPGSSEDARVGFLKANLDNEERLGMSKASAESLLALDPFVSSEDGNSFDPSTSDRFRWHADYGRRGSGSPREFALEDEIEISDYQSNEEFTTIVEDYSPGFLSAIGIGIAEKKHVESTTSHTNSSKVTSSKKLRSWFEFVTGEDEIYLVDVYVDRVFGTFAFKSAEYRETPFVQGTILQSDGSPAGDREVGLIQGGRIYNTISDQQGIFAFHAAKIREGNATLKYGDHLVEEIFVQPAASNDSLTIRLP